MGRLRDMSAAREANDQRAGELKPLGPLGVAAILFAVGTTTYLMLEGLAGLLRTQGGRGGLGDGDVWQAFAVNLSMARDNVFLILLSLFACAINVRERWRIKFTLLALCVVVLQAGGGTLSVMMEPKGEWSPSAYFAGSLATLACLVWAMVNSARNRSGIAVGIALLIAMPLLPVDPTVNRSVPLCVVAALPNCSRELTAPAIACGLLALEHLVNPGFALGIPWTLATLWLAVKGWRLASSSPVGSGERAALRAGLFLVGVSLLSGQMNFLQQALVAKSRMPRTPFADMAWLATSQGFPMIVAATLLRDVPSSNVAARQMRVVTAIWLVASLGMLFANRPPALLILIAALAMGVVLWCAVGAQLRSKPLT